MKIMRIYQFVFFVSFLTFSHTILAQDEPFESLQSLFPGLPSSETKNILVIVNPEHPQPCTPIYSNSFSNTNLFSPSESRFFGEIIENYKNVTTNSGPPGSVFNGWVARQIIRPKLFENSTNITTCALFVQTNSNAKIEVAAFYDSRIVMVRFRTVSQDGYDLLLYDRVVRVIEQYKNNVLDGLFIGLFLGINTPAKTSHEGEIKCSSLLRLQNGKAVGKYFGWDDESYIGIELEFKKPFDFLKYQDQRLRFDFFWTEAATITNR